MSPKKAYIHTHTHTYTHTYTYCTHIYIKLQYCTCTCVGYYAAGIPFHCSSFTVWLSSHCADVQFGRGAGAWSDLTAFLNQDTTAPPTTSDGTPGCHGTPIEKCVNVYWFRKKTLTLNVMALHMTVPLPNHTGSGVYITPKCFLFRKPWEKTQTFKSNW